MTNSASVYQQGVYPQEGWSASTLATASWKMHESLKQVSLVDWGRFIVYVVGLAILGGIWWEDKNSEGEELAQRINTQAEIFADRMTAISGRISSLEAKQATALSDIEDVKSDIKVMARDLSFLAQTIEKRGVERDRQMKELQDTQHEIVSQVLEKFEHVTQQISENRLWTVQAIQQQQRQEEDMRIEKNSPRNR